jgi:hypothetical protein
MGIRVMRGISIRVRNNKLSLSNPIQISIDVIRRKKDLKFQWEKEIFEA